MKKSSKVFFIPKIMILPLALSLIWNSITYFGTRLITKNWYHINAEISLDYSIPFIPWTVLIYFTCYIFWFANYILGSRQVRKEAFRFLSADIFAKTICFICFILIPTTNTRPVIIGTSIWETLMLHLYSIDAASNLFPSIHCLTSWFSYIAVRKNKSIPRLYVVFSLLYALAVCVSTLTTKQHVLLDVIGGVGLAELSYSLVDLGFARIYEKFIFNLNKRLGLENEELLCRKS